MIFSIILSCLSILNFYNINNLEQYLISLLIFGLVLKIISMNLDLSMYLGKNDACLQQIQKNIMNVALNSGLYLFRLGKYQQCIETSNMDYNILFMGARSFDDQSIFIGACLPKSCSKQLIKQTVNLLLDSISYPLQVKQVRNHLNQFTYPYNWAFFLTLFILLSLFLVVLASTFSQKLRQNKMLEVFSIQNTTKIFAYKQGTRLNVLNGIRSLAMLWIIFGHQMSLAIGYSMNILTVEKYYLSKWPSLLVEGGIYSVDIFFFVGGFLVAYNFIKDHTKSGLKYIYALLNRFLRFLPSYFIAIMLYYAISPHLGTGPFWQNQVPPMEDCRNFWRPLLFVDNLIDNGQNMCMAWGWYLQNDMQLFIFSLLVLFIYSKSRFWSFITIFVACGLNFAFVMTSTFQNKYKWMTHLSDAGLVNNYQFDIYFKPWGRCPPYLYGLLFGLLYNQFLIFESKYKKKYQLQYQEEETEEIKKPQSTPVLIKLQQTFQKNQWKRRIFELIGLLICLFIVFIPRTAQGETHYWPQFVHSVYLTYAKIMFVFGLSLMILPSLIMTQSKKGHRSLVHFLMDTKAFNYIAKVSFWSYLIHFTLLVVYFGTRFTDFYYSFVLLVGIFGFFAVISVLSGTFFVYLVEAPFTQLQKILMKNLSSNRKKRQNKLQKEQLKLNQTTIKQNKLQKPLVQ